MRSSRSTEGRRRSRDDQRGSLRRGLARSHSTVGARRSSTTCSTSPPTGSSSRACEPPLTYRRRPRGDARRRRCRVGRGALPRHPGGRPLRPRARHRPGALGAGDRGPPDRARRAQRGHREGAVFPRRRNLRPLRAGRRRRRPRARRVPDRVHAVSARDEPGRPPGDLRVPDGDLRAHRDGRLERLRVRRHDRGGRRVLRREACDRALEGRPVRDRPPPGTAGRQDLCAGLRPRDRRGRLTTGA